MSLPTSNSTTYVANSTPAIKAQDLNDLQTWLAYVYNNRYNFVFGTGADGAVTLDGAVTVPWASKSGSTYTLTRAPFCTTLTLNNGTTLKTQGYPIYCNTSFTLLTGSILTCNGGAAGATILNNYLNGSGVGGSCSNPSVTQEVNGSSPNVGPFSFGAAGGRGGTGSGGSGAFAGTAGTAPTFILPHLLSGGFTPAPPQQLVGGPSFFVGALALNTVQSFCGGSGGGSGGPTTSSGNVTGGQGGEGGGMILICSQGINLSGGTAQCNGGTGQPGQGGNGGGGGGGGGGGVVLLSLTAAVGTLTVTATGGAGGAGAGSGLVGVVGSNGASTPFKYLVS